MSTTRTILLSLGIAMSSFACAPSFAAPGDVQMASVIQTGASNSAGSVAVSSASVSPGRAFLAARAGVKGALQSIVSDPSPGSFDNYVGETIEISGRIVGRATLGSNVTLMIDSRGTSYSVSVDPSLNADDIDTGESLRMLVQVPTVDVLSAAHDVAPMVAYAPEAQVAACEAEDAEAAKQASLAKAREAVAQEAALNARTSRFSRTASLSSRSASYQFRASEPTGSPIAPLSQAAMSIYQPYRTFVWRANPRLTAHQIDAITTSVLYYCEQEKLDPRLVFAMIMAESNFDPYSTSNTGAMGLGQLMPETAAGLGVANAYDPVQNIGAAVHILADHVREYGGALPSGVVPDNTLILTMAAYNAGEGAVKKYGGVPPYRETQRYVRKVDAFYRQICGG